MRSSRAEPVRIAVLGGSSAFLPSLAAALVARAEELPPLDVCLHGRDGARAAVVASFCSRHALRAGVAHRYSSTIDVGEAARGASVVINQVRIGGFAGRSYDERLALAHGFPGDETIGPSGLSAAIRSLPRVVDLAREVERVAPDAWFLQMSNPMSMLLGGVLANTGLSAFGLCELPERTLAAALELVGTSEREVASDYVGLNHQGFFVNIEAGGRDLLPVIFDRIAELGSDSFFRVDADVMRARRALPLPYVRLYEHREREVEKMRARELDRGEELAALSARLYARYAAGDTAELPDDLHVRAMPWNAMTLVPVLVALLGGAPTEAFVSEPNAGYLDFLPDEAIVEKHVTVTRAGPQAPAPLRYDVARTHADVARMLAAIARFEMLGARAASDRSLELATEALGVHPFAIAEPTARELATSMLQADLLETRT